MIEEPNLSQANACSDIFANFKETTSRFDKQKRHLENEIEGFQIRHVQSVLSPHSSLLHLGSFRLFRPL